METEAERGIRFGLVVIDGMTVGIDIDSVSEVYPVRTVSELMTDAPGLLGAIELRGDPVPLYDPRPLCGVSGEASTPRIAVISAEGGRRLALGFDAISGLIEVPASRVKRFRSAGIGDKAPAFYGGFQDDGKTISIVDPHAILSRTELPAVPVAHARQTKGASDGEKPFLTFESGGARFGVEAVAVDATVPRQAIAPSSLTGGTCLGVITHHGRRVPVMHANSVLGIGAIDDMRTAEVVVLRFPDGRTLGFAVEAIRRIQLVAPARMKPVPKLMEARGSVVSAVFTEDEGRPTFLLDVEALTADKILCDMAALSEVVSEASGAATAKATDTDQEVVKERQRYLVVRAGRALAIPIGQLARIIEPPQRPTPFALGTTGLRGLFSVDGATTPLIDLTTFLGEHETGDVGRPRVLLVGAGEERVGFLVENVENIENSVWRREDPDGRQGAGLVCLSSPAGRRVLPKIDLETLAATLSVADAH